MNAIVLRGDARRLPLPDASVDLIVTSPPYYALRDYRDGDASMAGQIGSEATPAEWVAALVECTAEWMRVLKPSGSMFVNLGDKFAGGASGQQSGLLSHPSHTRGGMQPHSIQAKPVTGMPAKSLLGLPWRYALACTDQLGLILRRDIIWAKPNGLPESVTDRCRSSHEYLFHLVRQPRYYAAVDEIREPQKYPGDTGRAFANYHAGVHDATRSAGSGYFGGGPQNRALNPLGKLPGSVWSIPSQPLTVPAHLGVDHFAAFPMELPRRCVLGWSPPGICTSCGEGRRPVTHVERILLRPGDRPGVAGLNGDRAHGFDRRAGTHVLNHNTITGYACACPTPDAPTRPAIVLDPFGGTGTTALVAAMHGRLGVSIDRSADYTRLARWRTTDPGERAKALQVPKPPPVPDGMEALF